LRQTLPAKLQKGFTFEEPERFKLLIETCPVVFAYMPSIQRRKAHQKTQRNTGFLTAIVVVVPLGDKQIFFMGIAAFLVDFGGPDLRSTVPFLGGGNARTT